MRTATSCSFIKRLPLIFAWAAVFAPANALFAQAQTAPQHRALSAKVGGLVRDFAAKGSHRVGVSIRDVVSGRSIYDHRGDRLHIPASNQKLVASAAALLRLGPEHHFETTLHVLDGNMVVTGGFDPLLGDPVLAKRAEGSIYAELDALAVAAVERIGSEFDGDLVLVVDPDRPLRHPDWPRNQHRRWYCAPAGPLNFHDNCFDVMLKTDRGQVTHEVTPGSRFITLRNELSVGSRHLWGLRLADDDAAITLHGTASEDSAEPLSVAVDRPALLLGRVLADRLIRAGLNFRGDIRIVAPDALDLDSAVAIGLIRTRMADVLARANKNSLNLAGECLLLAAGDGTWPGSAKLAAQTIEAKLKLDPQSFRIADGSGMSRENRIAPAAMTLMLRNMLSNDGALMLLKSLSFAGIDGTLEDRFDEVYRGRVLGKTGYIAGVSCLSGYVLDEKSRPVVAFSVMAENCRDIWGAKRLQEAICRTIVEHLDRSSQQ